MKKSAKAPSNLSAEAKKMWREIQGEYQITDSGGLTILCTACEAFDRMRQAQKLIDTEGMVSADRFGQSKPHPAIVIERDSRGQMLAALKQLNLDLEPIRDRGRPVGGFEWKGFE
jgi:P27 family predicted phage terminase small subunit